MKSEGVMGEDQSKEVAKIELTWYAGGLNGKITMIVSKSVLYWKQLVRVKENCKR